ncbi:hypothetical protein [Nocardia fluminea]|uniref:hypothetical protein n=1 Tax=Nocardia fluminea TaxID=134984 RepID=UPI003D0E43F9
MTRVEWTLLSGEQVETVASMLLCSEVPTAQRLRPGQGDGGIDVFVPGPAGVLRSRTVYQVKNFATNLTNGQKRQIKRSFARVLRTSEAEGWSIDEWHLVCPLLPTPANLAWFAELTADAGFPCYWMDLDRLNLLASSYPNVVDWYLHDGRQRLSDAVDSLAAILAGRQNRQSGAPLTPFDVRSDLVGIYQAINAHDPHYRYAVEISHRAPSHESAGDPGLTAVSAVMVDGEVWVITKIYARTLAALEERPIPINLRLTAPADQPGLREDLQRFIDYGAPLTMPRGAASGTFDLPAGLGGEFRNGAVRILPITIGEAAVTTDRGLMLSVLDADTDSVLAELKVQRTERSEGVVGVRTVWRDSSGLVSVETVGRRADDGLSVGVDISMAIEIAGRAPEDIVDALRFISALHHPNRVALSNVYGPRAFDTTTTMTGDPDPELQAMARSAAALVTVQEHVHQRLLMPAQLTHEQAIALVQAANLLSGQLVHCTWDQLPIALDEPSTFAVDDEFDFCLIRDMEIELDTETITVGRSACFMRGRIVEADDDHIKVTPTHPRAVLARYVGEDSDGHVRYRSIQTDQPLGQPLSGSLP